jgi:hypothetical protein
MRALKLFIKGANMERGKHYRENKYACILILYFIVSIQHQADYRMAG